MFQCLVALGVTAAAAAARFPSSSAPPDFSPRVYLYTSTRDPHWVTFLLPQGYFLLLPPREQTTIYNFHSCLATHVCHPVYYVCCAVVHGHRPSAPPDRPSAPPDRPLTSVYYVCCAVVHGHYCLRVSATRSGAIRLDCI